MDAWATITVAVTGALFGGFLGSWVTTRMRIQHEREEALRERMIEAADEFARSSIEALNALYRLVHVVEPEDLDIDEETFAEVRSEADLAFEAPLAEAEPRVDETRVHLARVHLLFGNKTDVGFAASALVFHVSHVVHVVRDEPGIPDVNLARSALGEAYSAYDQFTKSARAAIRRPALANQTSDT